MKTNLTMNVKDGGVMCECANCDWRGPLDECEAVENLGQRIAPGEIVPAGECPECGALAHLVETEADENLGPDLRDAVIDTLEWFDNKGMINGCSFDEKSVRDRLAECLGKEAKRPDAPTAARELMEALAECWTHEGAPALAHPDIEFSRRRLRAINEIVAGAEKQQHTFSLLVISSEGTQAPEPGAAIRRKGRNLYRNDCLRLRWDDESKRGEVAKEKHKRGAAARAAREERKQGSST